MEHSSLSIKQSKTMN